VRGTGRASDRKRERAKKSKEQIERESERESESERERETYMNTCTNLQMRLARETQMNERNTDGKRKTKTKWRVIVRPWRYYQWLSWQA